MIYKETHKERQMGQSIKSYFLLESGIFEIVMVLKILFTYVSFMVNMNSSFFFCFFFQILMTRSQVMTN